MRIVFLVILVNNSCAPLPSKRQGDETEMSFGLYIWFMEYLMKFEYFCSICIRGRGVARAFPDEQTANPENHNGQESEEKIRKLEKI